MEQVLIPSFSCRSKWKGGPFLNLPSLPLSHRALSSPGTLCFKAIRRVHASVNHGKRRRPKLEETETDGGIHPSQEQLIDKHLSALLSPTEEEKIIIVQSGRCPNMDLGKDKREVDNRYGYQRPTPKMNSESTLQSKEEADRL